MSEYYLSNRAFLRLTGLDAERFLNGQVTQDISLCRGGRVLWTAVTNAKGQIEGVGCVRALDEHSFLFDCPLEIGDEMEARLDRYLISDDCEWSREDDRWVVILGDDSKGEVSNRFKGECYERVVSDLPDGLEPLPKELELEWCVKNGVPTWGREINQGVLPVECGLHSLALSFHKGCYIGQEIISRMETAGKARKRLYSVLVDGETELNSADFSTYSEWGRSKGGLLLSKKSPEASYDDAQIIKF